MQNTFIIKLFKQLESTDKAKEKDINFELKEYTDIKQIQECLSVGSCIAALDYDYHANKSINNRSQRQLQSDATETILLPILDDPVLSITLP